MTFNGRKIKSVQLIPVNLIQTMVRLEVAKDIKIYGVYYFRPGITIREVFQEVDLNENKKRTVVFDGMAVNLDFRIEKPGRHNLTLVTPLHNI